ncbi:DMT family transporter [Shimia sp. MIT1388]|uniref:DMT family transporter n=1 Tax=Shimia sp. MIT1388 TaxID=3096992 RepID=UPI00399B4D70
MNEHSASQDRPMLGIALMLGFSVLAPFGDAIVKLLGPILTVATFTFYRFGLQAVFLSGVVLFTTGLPALTRRQYGLIFLRTLCHIAGLSTIFMAFRYLPLADAVAIAFVVPFIQLLLGKVFLNEQVGKHRLAACTVGFVGTLLVIQPNFATAGLAVLWPVATAWAFAFFVLLGRTIAQEADPIAIQMVSGWMAVVLMVPAMVAGAYFGWHEFRFMVPTGQTLLLVIGAGVLGTLAHLLMTWSLRFAPSATLAPLTYIEIPITVAVGLVVFGDFPNALATLGICITMAAGLYVVFRERAIQRASQAAS